MYSPTPKERNTRVCCIVSCILFWMIAITLACLIPFLVQIPSASIVSFQPNCGSDASCLSSQQIPVIVTVDVHNPNIISADVSSNDLLMTDRNNGAAISNGVLPTQHVSSRTDTLIQATFIFNATNPETALIVEAVYVQHQSYPVHVSGHLKISVGAITYTYTLNEDGNIPAQ